MSTLFISHSSSDNEAARELARRLREEQGHQSMFLDLDPEQGIQPGQSWERTLYRKLRACRAVVVLCTDAYLRSHWCFAEVALARMEGKEILALLVDPLSPDAKLPSILTERQFIDLRSDPEEGYGRLWAALERLDLLGASGEWDASQSPYLGLSAFQERHAPLFFGRGDEIRQGLELLDRGSPGLVMVLGASGSGKSSLVRAGIVPRLRRDEERWLLVEAFRPGADPFGELAGALADAFPEAARDEWSRSRIRRLLAGEPVAADDAGGGRGGGAAGGGDLTGSLSAATLSESDERVARLLEQLEELRRQPPETAARPFVDFLDWTLSDLRRICGGEPTADGPDREVTEPSAEPAPTETEGRDTGGGPDEPAGRPPLVSIAEELRRLAGRREARVLLIVDQFEEVLGGGGGEDDVAGRFLSTLRTAVETGDGPLMALATMRSDFLGLFQRDRALSGLDFESLSVGAMSPEGMRQVIEEPAKLGAIELESGLTDRLLADTETPDALPLLSFTLRKLWQESGEDGTLRIADYERFGGLDGALAAEAEAEAGAALRGGLEADLRQAFLQMARLTEEGSFARRPVGWDDLPATVRPVLERMVERRLLVSRGGGGGSTVEVAHEALFRSWDRLAGWLEDHRADKLLEQQVQRDARQWLEAGRPAENLWAGGRLERADEVRRSGRLRLEGGALEFVEASLDARARQRRRKVLTLGAIAAALVIVAVGGISLWLHAEAQRARAEAQTARALDASRVSLASQWLDRDPTIAALVLLEVESPDDTPQAIDRMRQALERGVATVLAGSGGDAGPALLESPRLSPDGSRVLLIEEDGVIVWSADGRGRPTRLEGCDAAVEGPSFDGLGARVLAACGDSALVWEPERSPDPLRLKGHQGAVTAAAFSPGGERVVTASEDGTARIWRLDDPAEPLVLAGHEGPVNDAAFGPAGESVVTASSDGTARLWTSAGAPLRTLIETPDEPLEAIWLQADGARVVALGSRLHLASTDRPDEAVALEPPETKLVRTPTTTFEPGHAAVVVLGEWETSIFLTASIIGQMKVAFHDNRSGDEEQAYGLQGHEGIVSAADFSADRLLLVTGSFDSTVRLWTLDAEGLEVIGGYGAILQGMAGPSTGAKLLIDDDNNSFMTAVAVLRGHQGAISSAAFSGDGSRIVTTSFDGTARLWRTDATDLAVRLDVSETRGLEASFSRDGELVLVAGEDGEARVASVLDGRTVHSYDLGDAPGLGKVVTASFSPDGEHLLIAYSDGTAALMGADGDDRPILLGEPRDGSRLLAAAFGSDGERVTTAVRHASGTPEEPSPITVTVWRTDTPQTPPATRQLPPAAQVALGPRGRTLLTGSADGAVTLWPLDGPDEPLVLRHGEEADREEGPVEIAAVAFSPDGSRVAAAWETTVQVWRADGSDRGAAAQLDRPAGDLTRLALSPGGERILTTQSTTDGGPGATAVWPLEGGDPAIFSGSWIEETTTTALSPNGGLVATGSDSGTIRVWPSDGSAGPMEFREPGGPFSSPALRSVAFSPAGDRLLTISRAGVAIWPLTGELYRQAIRQATTACLDADFRTQSLGESRPAAEARAAACEASFGRASGP